MNNFLPLGKTQIPQRTISIFSLACMLIGVVYFALISSYVGETSSENPSTALFNTEQSKTIKARTLYVNIFSPLGRDANLNLVASPKIHQVTLNNENIRPGFKYPKTRVSSNDKTMGNVYPADLTRGNNTLEVTLERPPRANALKIGQRYYFIDYIIFAILLLIPFSWFSFQIFIQIFDYFLKYSWKPIGLTGGILIVAMILRLWYALDMGATQFQHDYHGHIEYLEFIAQQNFVPLPHKAWEFPQQPLYYLANGFLWKLLASFDVPKESILSVISIIGALLSCTSLYFAYKLVQIVSPSRFVQNTTLAFLCFTPSLIYMSTRINNDAWAVSFAVIGLYYLVSSYQSQFNKQLIPALIFCALAFLIKVSLLVIQVLFIALLITAYIQHFQSKKITHIQHGALSFALLGSVLLSYTLYRAYYPVTNGFFLVNSGIWGGQDLRPVNIKYFFSFNLFDIIRDAQANITADDNHAITRSFPSYQFISMLFGEFKYDYWRERNNSLYFNMQLMSVLALIVPLGWIAFIWAKKNILDKLFIASIGLSLLLIIKFIFDFPSVSNTDFRYHLSVFFILAFLFARGIETLRERLPKLKSLINTWLSALFLSQILFMISLIRI